MKKKNVFVSVVILFSMLFIAAIFCVCPFSPGSLLWDAVLYPGWINLTSPHPRTGIFGTPTMIYNRLPDNSYSLRWADDGSAIIILGTDWGSDNREYNNFVLSINPENGDIVSMRTDLGNESVRSEGFWDYPEIYENITVWGDCPEKELLIRGRDLSNNRWELELLEEGEYIDSFHLSSDQWDGSDISSFANLAVYGFSPTCDHFAVGLWGWIYYEGDGQPELWLLDIPNRTFEEVIRGRWPIIGLWDYPVQSVSPGWSSNGDEFVFGDDNYGLEIYRISDNNRRWLVGPNLSGDYPTWSPSGKWIASIRDSFDKNLDVESSIILISEESNLISEVEDCSSVSDIAWAPMDDRLAYLCYESSDGLPGLWIWTPN